MKKAFDKIAAGLNDAIAFAGGDETRARAGGTRLICQALRLRIGRDAGSILEELRATPARHVARFGASIGVSRTPGPSFYLSMIEADPEAVEEDSGEGIERDRNCGTALSAVLPLSVALILAALSSASLLGRAAALAASFAAGPRRWPGARLSSRPPSAPWRRRAPRRPRARRRASRRPAGARYIARAPFAWPARPGRRGPCTSCCRS